MPETTVPERDFLGPAETRLRGKMVEAGNRPDRKEFLDGVVLGLIAEVRGITPTPLCDPIKEVITMVKRVAPELG